VVCFKVNGEFFSTLKETRLGIWWIKRVFGIAEEVLSVADYWKHLYATL
jgi:hypothetical protein